MDGFPKIGRFAHVEVLNTEIGAAPGDISIVPVGNSGVHKGPPSVN